jgi:hypothetical protein
VFPGKKPWVDNSFLSKNMMNMVLNFELLTLASFDLGELDILHCFLSPLVSGSF